MNDFDQEKAEHQCARFSAFISEVEPLVFSWITAKTKLEKDWNKYIKNHKDISEKMPESWENFVKAQCAFSAVFCFQITLRKIGSALSQIGKSHLAELLHGFEEKPWYYALFTIKKKLENDFYLIINKFNGEERILKSPSLGSYQQEPGMFFFALLFDNGICLQVYGIISYFVSFTLADLRLLAECSVKGRSIKENISDLIAQNPLPFVYLTCYGAYPPIKHNKDIVLTCISGIVLDYAAPPPMPDEYLVYRNNTIIVYSDTEQDIFRQIDVIFDFSEDKILVFAKSLQCYAETVQKLSGYIKLPARPQQVLNPLTLTLAKELCGYTHQYEKYTELIAEARDAAENEASKTAYDPSELEIINTAAKEILDCQNNGRPCDFDAIARKYKLNEGGKAILEQLAGKSAYDPFAIDLPYALEGYTAPPPSFRHLFAGTFLENDLFGMRYNPETIRLFEQNYADRASVLKSYNIDTEIPIFKFSDTIDMIFEAYPGLKHPVILNYTIYLLHKMGDNYAEARQYACAVLDIFHQVFLQEPSPENISAFFKAYSRFLYLVLKPLGLVKTDKAYSLPEIRSGTFKVAPSEFFSQWIEFYA